MLGVSNRPKEIYTTRTGLISNLSNSFHGMVTKPILDGYNLSTPAEPNRRQTAPMEEVETFDPFESKRQNKLVFLPTQFF